MDEPKNWEGRVSLLVSAVAAAFTAYGNCAGPAATQAGVDDARSQRKPYITIIPRPIVDETGDDTRGVELEIKNTGGSPAIEPYLTLVRCDQDLKCLLMSKGRSAGELHAGGEDRARVVLPECGFRPNAPGDLFLVVYQYGDSITGKPATGLFYSEFVKRSGRTPGESAHEFVRISTKVQARMATVLASIGEAQAACEHAVDSPAPTGDVCE